MAKSKSNSSKIITEKVPTASANFKAALTDKQVFAGEKIAQEWGVTRRIACALLTRNAEQLLEGLRDGGDDLAEAMMGEAENLRDYLAWREKETELLNAALVRMLLVVSQYSNEVSKQ